MGQSSVSHLGCSSGRSGIVGRDQLTAGQRRAVGGPKCRSICSNRYSAGRSDFRSLPPASIRRRPYNTCRNRDRTPSDRPASAACRVGPPVVSVAGHVFPAAGTCIAGPPADIAGACHQPHAAGYFAAYSRQISRRQVRVAILAQHQFDAERGLLGSTPRWPDAGRARGYRWSYRLK